MVLRNNREEQVGGGKQGGKRASVGACSSTQVLVMRRWLRLSAASATNATATAGPRRPRPKLPCLLRAVSPAVAPAALWRRRQHHHALLLVLQHRFGGVRSAGQLQQGRWRWSQCFSRILVKQTH